MEMFRGARSRSIVKAFSWRIAGTVATVLIVFMVTRSFTLSLAVGALEFATKIAMFPVHERMWDRLRFTEETVPAVLWFTGLSGSGKSTVSDWVAHELRGRGLKVEQLDGDRIRDIFPNTGFSRPERDAHIRRVGYLASKLEHNGVFVVASFVSPYRESRDFVRTMCHRFMEIHVATPLDECERRDVKGLYAKARRGEIHNFTGIDDPYEAPVAPELVLDTTRVSVEEAGRRVLSLLDQRTGTV